MKQKVYLSGTIIKHEKLVHLNLRTPDNIFIAEATSPYANYYGQIPRKANPNSLFLFTKRFHYLEEVISYAKGVEKCLFERINIASAVVESGKMQYPAIRLKNFPDYSQLVKLQNCLTNQGIVLLNKVHLEEEVKAKINKLFVLDEVENGFYIDTIEDNKGYFIIDQKLSYEAFTSIFTKIRNNGNCKLFDAVNGQVIKDGNIIEIIRIYSEGLDLEHLKCIKKEFERIK